MTNKPIINVAHCGLGKWGPNLLRNLGENAQCQVVALCDPDKDRLKEFGQRYPQARLYTDVAQVAADPDIQAVILATPAGLHHDQAKLVLESGKDALVEKPLAMDIESAAQLVRLAREQQRVLMVGHTFLFNSAVRKVKEEIDAGTLGDLQLILARRLSLGRIRSDCNALWNLAPHDVSILLYWLGVMPERVTARGIAFHENHQQEDYVECLLEFPNRVAASIQVSWMNPVKVRDMTVIGSQQMLTYDDVDQKAPLTLHNKRVEEVERCNADGSFEAYQLEIRPGDSESLTVDQAEPLAAEIAHFLHCVQTREEPTGSGQEALRIMSVLDACNRSIKEGGNPIKPVVNW